MAKTVEKVGNSKAGRTEPAGERRRSLRGERFVEAHRLDRGGESFLPTPAQSNAVPSDRLQRRGEVGEVGGRVGLGQLPGGW
jgi:hypothetical protein